MSYYWSAQRCLRWWIDGYWPTRVTGLEHVPRSGPLILAGNHPTVLDGLILALWAPRRVNFLVRSDVMALPVLGRFLQSMGYISVARGGRALQQAGAALAQGRCIGIFPEADPTFSLQLNPFRRGAAVLAQTSGAPLVPFAVRGTERCCGAGALSAGPGPVELRFAPALTPYAEESAEALTERLRVAVQELLLPAQLPSSPPRRGGRWLACSLFFRPASAAMLALAARRITPPPATGPARG